MYEMTQNADPAALPEDDSSTQALPPMTTQIRLPKRELQRIQSQIESDKSAAESDHDVRMRRNRKRERMWRDKIGLLTSAPDESNFNTQVAASICMAKHAREIEAVFGGQAVIQAVPTAPSDKDSVDKVGVAMTWKVFESMDCERDIALLMLNRLKFGVAHAWVPWSVDRYSKFKRDPQTGQGAVERIVYREGPAVQVLDEDNILTPAEPAAKNPDDFSWIIIRSFETPAKLLQDEQENDLYFGVQKNWDKILKASRQGIIRDSTSDQVAEERDKAEGVQRDSASSTREGLEVWRWFAKWRLPVEGMDEGASGDEDLMDDDNLAPSRIKYQTDGDSISDEPEIIPGAFKDHDGTWREMEETDIEIAYLPALGRDGIIGAQRLDEKYPDSPKKRPILRFALIHDGSYYPPGIMELIEEVQAEINALVNRTIEAVDMAIGPPIFGRVEMAHQ